jgi:hypothetical protein
VAIGPNQSNFGKPARERTFVWGRLVAGSKLRQLQESTKLDDFMWAVYGSVTRRQPNK